MTPSTLHKLLLSRRLYELAQENVASNNELSLSIGINLLQDAVEIFLLAVSEHVNADVKSKTPFEKYFDLINAEIAPKKLPFRSRLVALNKLRVNSKHHGLAPAHTEAESLFITVGEFLVEVAESVLDKSFASISLMDLLQDGEAKTFLKQAEAAFTRGDFEGCLIDCRKAIYVRIEKEYDISQYGLEKEPDIFSKMLYGRRAPFFVKNKEYVRKNVKEPTDYIVFDHNVLEVELMKSGMDRISFWNIWRLTPDLWREPGSNDWFVKRELSKFEADGIRDRAEYVLDKTITLFVAADQKAAGTRSIERQKYFVYLRREAAPIYEKADRSSRILETTPKGLMQIHVDYMVPSLDGKDEFWHVSHFSDGVNIWGYLPDDAVQYSEE